MNSLRPICGRIGLCMGAGSFSCDGCLVSEPWSVFGCSSDQVCTGSGEQACPGVAKRAILAEWVCVVTRGDA